MHGLAGTTKSYKWIAETIGRPRACCFVGYAPSKNPFPLLISCHRVIHSTGDIKQFGGGQAMKKELIALEIGAASREQGEKAIWIIPDLKYR
jgi:methylated-DNA-[protein]-cysteine S-methyltransferase